jgi:hypothetical protein
MQGESNRDPLGAQRRRPHPGRFRRAPIRDRIHYVAKTITGMGGNHGNTPKCPAR